MASIIAISLAAMMHLVLRVSFYIQPNEKQSAPGPALPTIIVCIALLDIIYDNRILPQRYECMVPKAFKYLCEAGIAIFFLEVGMLIFWATIEYVIYLTSRALLLSLGLVSMQTYNKHETFMVGLFTVPLSLFILAMTGQATDHFHLLQDHYLSVQTLAALRLDNAMKFLRRTDEQQRHMLRLAVKNHDAARKGQERGRHWTPHFESK
ncbi:uncharacterized protein LOC115629023 [Scaptodrosophila lebanonensis]|uniref:Uncharacterized protein LOC115629023 n=1 Tax=Drosophila lebanonensis TaxID=7225 RepID=A0A6J2TZU4_DROLE|nr:uncharacterized protein LOC115629023 [Scaptodrosophila lebanonensis]